MSEANKILEAAAEAVVILNSVREREGAATALELRERCAAICGLVTRMEQIRAGAVEAFQKRLKEKLADLLAASGIDPQRLAQEAEERRISGPRPVITPAVRPGQPQPQARTDRCTG